MGKIFYIMGKSSSGKDTIYSRLRIDEMLGLSNLVLYTTRPMRGRKAGERVLFCWRRTISSAERSGKSYRGKDL